MIRSCLACLLLIPLSRCANAAESAGFDLRGFLDAQLAAGSKQIVVPAGRYRVTPIRGQHLDFKDIADTEIIADGVELVCTQTVQAIGFERCRNVHLRGITVDYDPLPYTEGRITALAPDKSWIEFTVLGGYPETGLEERIEIYDPATGELRRTDAGWAKSIQSLGEHRYRASKAAGYRYREGFDTEQLGDLLVTNNGNPPGAGGHAIVSAGCDHLKLEDVTVYASPCFGFLEHRCTATEYLHCRVDRRSPQDDPVKRDAARMRSLDADAFHSSEATVGPQIIGCTAKFQGDDCVNIHGVYHLVTACEGNTLRVATLGRSVIEPNDPIEFLPYNGKRPGDAVAQKIERDAPLSADEVSFIARLNLNADNKRRLLSADARLFRVTLDHPVDLPMGSAICSGNRVGNGFAVRNCDFGYNRSRGILIKASRGEVSGNRITHGWMAAVLVSPEFWWSEAASSSDVKISGNTIVGCRRPAIEVVAPGGDGKPLASGAHRNITIADNVIEGCAWPVLRIQSTDGLVIANNRIPATEPAAMNPPLAEPWRWGKASAVPMLIEQCDQPQVHEAH